MASNSHIMFIILGIVAILVPSISAVEFVVGDEKGWTINFDYQTWAQDKQGAHNVLRVNGTGFQQCVAPAETQALRSGNDVITLETPGRKWYICGVSRHCAAANQKLFITVLPQVSSPASSPAPTPSPTSAAATTSFASSAFGRLLGMIGLVGVFVA
ncbi:hypothetical protein FNV43_RR09153 [Rhamnella rubrinervis]|uniref:Phytocyanin domain-containing protein n=1 Tax=Rhamnella rubrinervis TaxID=2594499 RepID=A0A8K0HAN7_9ROSA|nr:hypothetical protein FNV43_RR09153 [Rhamnella rubrinervis]